MYAGKLTKIQIKYNGRNVEAILDRLPTARVISQEERTYIIEAEVYGNGILMWLLSQGKYVEVLKPIYLREQMKKLLQEILGQY